MTRRGCLGGGLGKNIWCLRVSGSCLGRVYKGEEVSGDV